MFQKSIATLVFNSPCGEAVKNAILHAEQAHSVLMRTLISSKWQVGSSVVLVFSIQRDFSRHLKSFSTTSISVFDEKHWTIWHHYQSSHLCLGFIGASALQPKCWENSWELEMVPMTLNLDGLWGSVMTPSWELSGVLTEHHTCNNMRGGGAMRRLKAKWVNEGKYTGLNFIT